ncbi:SET domain-containing protein-lysine N-methyltransferase [Estrella lausannensis]|uniref:SET domain-containing protein-lysine N-methyltransferase n=1 Tax=Estrella lausannensis TaxID=483423 RepID=UPI00117AEBC9|nr:SET domain-containing protein-lysine N-methyltransferase [Estrella lausannensis]
MIATQGAFTLARKSLFTSCWKGHLPPLHQAVVEGDLPFILQNKANPKHYLSKDNFGFSAGELALLLGKLEMAKEFGYRPPTHILFQDKGKAIDALLTEHFEERFDIRLIPSLTCPSYSLLKESIRQCPFSYRYTALGSEMKRKGSLYREELFHMKQSPCSVRFVDEMKGFGLFAEKRLTHGEWIGEYCGLLTKLEREELDTDYIVHYPTRFFSMNLFGVDAKKKCNLMRFANHKDRPNAAAEYLLDRGLLHLAFFAIGEIAPGEEITIDYGRDYWMNRSKR